jgi:hypothetical protein
MSNGAPAAMCRPKTLVASNASFVVSSRSSETGKPKRFEYDIDFARLQYAHLLMLPQPLPERVYTKYKERIEDIYKLWKKMDQISGIGSPVKLSYQ